MAQFTYSLHDESFHEMRDWIADQMGIESDNEVFDKMGKPFYEVKLLCDVDMETGKVTILQVDGHDVIGIPHNA